jgi:hypothetical protein
MISFILVINRYGGYGGYGMGYGMGYGGYGYGYWKKKRSEIPEAPSSSASSRLQKRWRGMYGGYGGYGMGMYGGYGGMYGGYGMGMGGMYGGYGMGGMYGGCGWGMCYKVRKDLKNVEAKVKREFRPLALRIVNDKFEQANSKSDAKTEDMAQLVQDLQVELDQRHAELVTRKLEEV